MSGKINERSASSGGRTRLWHPGGEGDKNGKQEIEPAEAFEVRAFGWKGFVHWLHPKIIKARSRQIVRKRMMEISMSVTPKRKARRRRGVGLVL